MTKILKLSLWAVFVVWSTALIARPAWRGVLTKSQPDGTSLSCYLIGDEHFHSFVTTDGYLITEKTDGGMYYLTHTADGMMPSAVLAHNEPGRSADEKQLLKTVGMKDFAQVYQQKKADGPLRVKKSGLAGNFPTKGEVKGLVVLVEFKDNEFQEEYTRELYERQLNEQGYSDYGATGSARDYFISQSMGQFTPYFDVVGPVKLPKIMSYYGASSNMGNDVRPNEMVVDACNIAHDELGVDFSQYDYNNDGEVDFVFILYAGYGQSYGASDNTIWPHMSTLHDQHTYLTLDEKAVNRYACSCELNGNTGTEIDGIGAVCHEFGHVLGLPDFYNTFSSSQTQLGSWDVMDGGSYNNNSRTPPSYTAFERYSLGWMDLTQLDTPSDSVAVEEISQNNVGYRINTANENEFFTLENHQQVGWDKYEAGRGLMIIHVVYDQGAWDNNSVNSGMAPRYDLIEADGTQGYDQGTDLYPIPGNDMFTDYSTPNSLSWEGTPTEKGVTNIRDVDGVICFRFMKDRLSRPVLTEATEVTDHSFTANWLPVEGAQYYAIDVRELLPDSLNPIVLDEDFSLMKEADYPNSGYTDISRQLSDYCHRSGWSGADVYPSNGYVRIGSYGKSGTLTTPALDLTEQDGAFTVAFHGVSYPGKKVSYTVSHVDDAGHVLQTVDLKADKNEQWTLLSFRNGTAHSRISFATKNERFFLNDVRIVKGEVDSAMVANAGPKAWTVDSIADNHCLVDGLVSNRTYLYKVYALATGGMTGSLPSTEQQVTTEQNTAIYDAKMDANRHILSVDYYDLAGRRVSKSTQGIIIRRIIYSDGTCRIIKLHQ